MPLSDSDRIAAIHVAVTAAVGLIGVTCTIGVAAWVLKRNKADAIEIARMKGELPPIPAKQQAAKPAGFPLSVNAIRAPRLLMVFSSLKSARNASRDPGPLTGTKVLYVVVPTVMVLAQVPSMVFLEFAWKMARQRAGVWEMIRHLLGMWRVQHEHNVIAQELIDEF